MWACLCEEKNEIHSVIGLGGGGGGGGGGREFQSEGGSSPLSPSAV